MNKETNITQMINEMKAIIKNKPKLTLENFILPEEIGQFEDETDYPTDVQDTQDTSSSKEVEPQTQNDLSAIKKELDQIRKIALNVITRLAEHSNSESYILMKKIWNMVDKASENNNENNNDNFK